MKKLLSIVAVFVTSGLAVVVTPVAHLAHGAGACASLN